VAVTPSWLYDLFAALTLVVAAYSMTLLVVTGVVRRPAGWDVDVAHILMGVSMAGMFVVSWAFGPSSVWESLFAIMLAWFLIRSGQTIRQYGIHVPHYLIHAVMSLAMFLMFAFPGVPSVGGSMSPMAMPMSVGSRLDPGAAFVLALALLGSAIFTLGSSKKGASHHGSHGLAYARTNGFRMRENGSTEGHSYVLYAERVVTTPWVEDASHVAMCVAMGFLLILMI
jgi:hypothetical protein